MFWWHRNTLLDLLALAAPSEAKPRRRTRRPAALLNEMVNWPLSRKSAVRRRGQPVPHQLRDYA